MARRITITGSTLRSRASAFKSALAAEVEQHVWGRSSQRESFGRIFLRSLASMKLPKHMSLMESSRHIGKIVLAFSVK